MALADQPDAYPTNKLTVAAMIAPAVTEAYQNVMTQFYAPLSGPAMGMLAGAAAAMIAGYFVPDRDNVGRG